MSGMTAWNFADFGSEFRGDAIPHVNQKGLVQYDRTPKQIYYWYKSVLEDKPFVYLATDYLSDLTLFGDENYPIQIFSNQERASVFLNDEKLQDVNIHNGFATVNIPFANGENSVKVVSGNQSDEKLIKAKRINRLDFKGFNRFGINIGSHFYFSDDNYQITFVPDQPYKKGWFGHLDGETFNARPENHQGIPYNIKNTTSDPLFQTMLEDCTSYKVDVPDGTYKVSLFFVEPQIKPVENVYNLTDPKTETEKKKQRIFDVYVNDFLVQKQFNMAAEYHEKYGITLSSKLNIEEGQGLTISLKLIEGTPVISGVLIEKLD